MEGFLYAIRTAEVVLNLGVFIVLSILAKQSKGRRLVYAGALICLVHIIVYEISLLVANSLGVSDLTFFLYWVVGLRLHATSLILIYGIYFTRLSLLKK